MNIEQKFITSVEAAEMVGKDHSDLLKDIRRYSEQLGEGKISPTDFFTESTYQSGQNKELPCYLVTKKGCEFIANKLTGVKGAVFTAKYINRFNEMQEQLATHAPKTELQVLLSVVSQMVENEKQLSIALEQSQKALDTSTAIKDNIIGTYDNWRESINHQVSVIQKHSSMTYQEVWNKLYEALEQRGHCDLSIRVRNGRDRLRDSGSTKTQIEAFGRLDVIEADARLKEIFTSIVREYAVRYVA